MRLGFHYHVPAAFEGGRIRMPGYQGLFVDALAEHCSEVVCFLHTPVGSERQEMDYAIQSPSVRLVGLGPHDSVPRRLLAARRYAKILKQEARSLDVLLLRGPSPLLPTLAKAARPLPTTLLLVGDAVAGVEDLAQPLWRKSGIRIFWQWNRYGQDRIAKRVLTFVNSKRLFEELRSKVPVLVETRTTTLTARDFFSRDDTCLTQPFRLLYAGRMDRGKGLLDIVDALSILVREGEPMVFDMVGWPVDGDPILQEIQALSDAKGLAHLVRYHGRKAVGPELFSYYRRADVFVIASKSSEGFPRTIWEAMAHSLPVVATTVGSIPQFTSGAAELVPPNDITTLSATVRKVVRSPEVRQRMIRRGRELAAQVTLEIQVGRMAGQIKEWIQKQS